MSAKQETKTPLQLAMQEVSELNAEGIKVQGGKRYTQVSTRVEVFRSNLGIEYGIETTVVEFGSGVMAKAFITDPEGRTIATGHSYATNIAKEKSIEKLETTAVGRALAALGLAGGEYATQDEMETHAERYEQPKDKENTVAKKITTVEKTQNPAVDGAWKAAFDYIENCLDEESCHKVYKAQTKLLTESKATDEQMQMLSDHYESKLMYLRNKNTPEDDNDI